jgi:hypothetical protein
MSVHLLHSRGDNLRRPNAIPKGVWGNGLTNQNPPLALPPPLTYH